MCKVATGANWVIPSPEVYSEAGSRLCYFSDLGSVVCFIALGNTPDPSLAGRAFCPQSSMPGAGGGFLCVPQYQPPDRSQECARVLSDGL